MSSFWDDIVTTIADPNAEAAYQQQIENQAQLDARFAAEQASDQYTAAQKATLANVQRRDQIVDVNSGNAELFATTYANEIKSGINGAGKFVFSAIPWWVWAAAIGAALIYVAPAAAKLLPKK